MRRGVDVVSGALLITATMQVSLFPSLLTARMTAFPTPFAVIKPVLLTIATDGSEELHDKEPPAALPGVTRAESG